MNRIAKAYDFARSPCAAASTLDIVGDKWSLLVIRDLLRGKKTYGELQESYERIPTNILADRLRRLEEAGIIEKSAYQERPVRFAYALTAKGTDMGDILLALVRWGKKHIPGTQAVDIAKRESPAPARTPVASARNPAKARRK
ncbi:helix-turn-helix domain-containing protein [Dokdonella soli]|uniref:HTH hxlR-type domain-containing protein n=1 Tax=Dokdonella soli TaxID=529810 RepID=A0ABN1IIS9_9GAMM